MEGSTVLIKSASFLSLQYVGKWFELKHYKVNKNLTKDCYQEVYTIMDETAVLIENSGIKNGNRSITIASAVLADPTADPLPGKLSIFIHNIPGVIFNYLVLDTDYENYAIVWHCHNLRKGQKSGECGRTLERFNEIRIIKRMIMNIYFYLQRSLGSSHALPPLTLMLKRRSMLMLTSTCKRISSWTLTRMLRSKRTFIGSALERLFFINLFLSGADTKRIVVCFKRDANKYTFNKFW